MWRTRRNTSDRDALSLVVHGPEFRNGELLVLNPDLFPEIRLHDLVQVSQPERVHPRLVLSVECLAPVRGKLQVSVAKDIAAQFGLEAFRPVAVRRVDQSDVSVDFVELSFKDQFLSRADIWRFKVTMLGQCVYVGKTVECLGIRSQVDAILANHTHWGCGVIGDATKIVVRSRSSRLFWLVQMSTEMWEFAPDGEIYYEKLLNRLLRVLIAKWSESSVSHSVTVIAFSRSFYDANQFPEGFDPRQAPFSDPRRQGFGPGCGAPGINMANGYGPTIHVDPVTGRYYEDFYKVVVMNFTGPDWSRLLLLLKREFANYHEIHRWRTPEQVSSAQYEILQCPKPLDTNVQSVGADGITRTKSRQPTCDDCESVDTYVKWTKLPFGVPSRAKDGNILEAINVTLNVLDKHYMDRDLSRTGQGIVMMTAGCSIFNVNKKLAEITEQRMMDNGVGMDMISLATPPLHVVPLFIYETPLPEKAAMSCSQPNILRTLSFDEIAGSGGNDEANPLENASSRGVASATSASLPKIPPEWKQPSSIGFPNDSGAPTMVALLNDPKKLSYDIPHWVNITFLDFDCICGRGRNATIQPHTPLDLVENSSAAHQSCQCQFKQNQEFNPLPSFRMFDITAPSGKLEFPAALRNLIGGKAQVKLNGCSRANTDCFQNDKDKHDGDIGVAPLSIRLTGSKSRLLFESSELPDSRSSAPAPDHLQLSRSPDFNFIAESGHSRSDNDLSTSIYARAALQEYDENVFAPPPSRILENATSIGTRNSRSMCDRRLGFVPLESHDEHDGASATIAGYGNGHLERFIHSTRKEAQRTRERSNSSNSVPRKESAFHLTESDSVLQSLISPRNLKFSANSPSERQQRLKLTDHIQKQSSSPTGIPIASRSSPRAEPQTSFSLEVMLSSSMENRGSYRNRVFAASSTALSSSFYGAPGKIQEEKSFRPLTRALTLNKETSTSGRSSAFSSPSASDGLSRLNNNLRRLSNPGSPQGVLRRNQSELFKTPLMPNSLSFKTSSATDLSLTTAADLRKTIVNPFRYARGPGLYHLSSDRQRWSHLFPASNHVGHRTTNDSLPETAIHDGEPMFVGPNWTSLTSPAILPLTTDHFPSPQDLRQHYTEAFYTLTIPTTAAEAPTIECVPRYRNHDELLVEMICQRLARDFQLVSSCDSTALLMGNETSVGSRRRVYHLSMGHRIHQLIHDAERQTVEVKRFVQREPHDPEVASASYNFSLWVDLTKSFQPHQQIFHRYPQPEDNWNALDNLLCGYLDDMADTMKCRRIRFAIVPPAVASNTMSVGVDTPTSYAAKFIKFIDFLQSRLAPSEFGDLENITINLVLEQAESIRGASKVPHFSSKRMLSFKVACKASASTVSSSPQSKIEDSRTEWVMIRLEDTMDISRCFHLDVRWLACSGIAADEFVGTVRRRAKQAGLDLRRVPEYSSVSRVQIHPLVASIFLPFPAQVSEPFVIALTEQFDFVLDDERIADGSGIGYGLGIDQEASVPKPRTNLRGHRRSPSATARMMLQRWQQRGYKQFIHRRVSVFVRVIHDGLIWIPGYDYDRKGDGAAGVVATEALFRELCVAIEAQCCDCIGTS